MAKRKSPEPQADADVKRPAVKKSAATKKTSVSLKPDKKTAVKISKAKVETEKVEKIKIKIPNLKPITLIGAPGELAAKYNEAVQKAKQDDNWSEIVSQDVGMIAQNTSSETVANRLHNLNELLCHVWSVDEPNTDIGNLFFNCGGFEAVFAALRAHPDCLKVQLLGFKVLTALVTEVTSHDAAAQSRLRKRVLRVHAAGGIEAVLKGLAAHAKAGPQLGDAVTFLARMMLHCFDVDECRLKRFAGAKQIMMALYDEQDTEDLLARVHAPLAADVRSGLRTFRVGIVDGYS